MKMLMKWLLVITILLTLIVVFLNLVMGSTNYYLIESDFFMDIYHLSILALLFFGSITMTILFIFLLIKILDGSIVEIIKEIKSFLLVEDNDNDQYMENLKNDLITEDEGVEYDIITLMIQNMGELREYFRISKRQANQSFQLSVIMAILGFILFVSAVIMYVSLNAFEPSIVPLIGGFITEFVSIISLHIHKNSQKQLNHYYQALHENEKFLSAVHLVRKLNKDKREDAYMLIINNSLNININESQTDSSQS